jgi:DNA-binding IclR family transcriptional regulator
LINVKVSPDRMTSHSSVKSDAGGVAAVDRALAIVAAVAASSQPCSLAQLAAATGFYKSTILRLLGSLERTGYVVRLREGSYALGPMAVQRGAAYDRSDPLRRIVPPVLRDLVTTGSESASFHTRQGVNSRICLFRHNSHHSTLDRIDAGDLLPLDRGAAGRILLAFDGVAGAAFDRLRADWFAHSMGEREPGCAGMAVPVVGADNRLRGAVSLSGPAHRFTDEAIALWKPRLIAAGAEISRALGGRYPSSIG